MRIFGYYVKIGISSHSDEAFALRTCLSILVVACLALFPSTQRVMSHYNQNVGSPAIAAVVTAVVKDRTLGATILNGLGCIFGSLRPCSACEIILAASGNFYGDTVAIGFIPILSFMWYFVQFQGKMLLQKAHTCLYFKISCF